MIDMTNQIYKNWKVLQRTDKPSHIKSTAKSIWWLCECLNCGRQKPINGTEIRNGKAGACKCKDPKPKSESSLKYKGKQNNIKGSSIKNEIGNVYGKLTVIDFAYIKNTKAYWLCQCECGKNITTSGNALRSGSIHSCGCLTSYKEYEIAQFLLKNNIIFQQQFKFNDLIDKSYLRFDFAIFNSNKQLIGLIEYNGEQHYDINNNFYKDYIAKHDKMKIEYCQNNNISLLILNKDNYNLNFILSWIKNLI